MKFGVRKDQPTESEVKTMVYQAIAENHGADKILNKPMPPETMELPNPASFTDDDESEFDTPDRITGFAKLSQLVADDFPFDESQLAAIDGMTHEPYACLTGAAGTGKTTTTKKLVDSLLETVKMSAVNMKEYWQFGEKEYESQPGDDYEATQEWVPSVAMCAFTGRATQMIKKNFPLDWHGNIMTIHRMLAFRPETYTEYDESWTDEYGQKGGFRNKMRFVPTYGPDCKLPWDIIIIDEAGMLGLELWHQLLDATNPGTRIYMIGDINQLPPVHGKSVFGFAMAKWPSWELTHVHRQQGVNNPIVDNAWRILNGRQPVSEGRFQMLPLKDAKGRSDAVTSSKLIRKMIPQMKDKGFFDPIRDSIITPINGEEGSRGRELGQIPLNQAFALIFNTSDEHPRYIIDGGREVKQFAVGDKVMATRNDWEVGITNGMTGIIVDITEHAAYGGDRTRYGTVDEVNRMMAESDQGIGHVDFSLEDLSETMAAVEEGQKMQKEKRDRGPSSHIVTVRFGTEDHGQEIAFSTLAEVGSLMTAYASTCHKLQGGEAPVIIVILHDAHKAMLFREWLYTAVTRASEKCIILYTPDALRVALSKQSIKGATLQEKIRSFNALMDPKGLLGTAVKVRLPESTSTHKTMMEQKSLVQAAARHMVTEKERNGGVAQLLNKARQATQAGRSEEGEDDRASTQRQADAGPERVVHVHVHVTEHHTHTGSARESEIIKDGGEIRGQATSSRNGDQSVVVGSLPVGDRLALPAPVQLVSQWGAVAMLQKIERDRDQLRLPAPTPVEKPTTQTVKLNLNNKWAQRLGLGK